MKNLKALIINDVVKEPRTFEIYSKQGSYLKQKLYFELQLQDIEGFGTMFALLGHTNLITNEISQALNAGAEWKNVWVFEGLSNVGIMKPNQASDTQTDFDLWLNDVYPSFFETCHEFCFIGEYTGDSYTDMHKYNTIRAVFSSKYDADDFKRILDLIKSEDSFTKKKIQFMAIVINRKVIDLDERVTWDM